MTLLELSDPFPPVSLANQNAGGLLAIGADLSPQRLLEAYRQGIFPWGTHQDLPLWHYPNPRMVLFPDQFRISRSLHKTLRQAQYTIRLDSAFAKVIAACASIPRPGQNGTWISPDMQAAYISLHELGWAHCVETWMEGKLVGGLYGLAIGRVFFGESMFSHRKDASKIAFAHLARFLTTRQFGMIDCQMYTPHLASLGGHEIVGDEFSHLLAKLIDGSQTPQHWPENACNFDWGKA